MDKLEEFIKNNRSDLDIYSPSSGVWRRIKKAAYKGKSRVAQWLSVAAMFVVILGTAVVLFKPWTIRSGAKMKFNSNTVNVSANPQLKETEIYYNSLLNSLYREATPLLTGNPEINKELGNDISQLDSICSEIKKDLKDNVANQEVVEALIQNYRIKISLLEDVLTILKENENNKEKIKGNEL